MGMKKTWFLGLIAVCLLLASLPVWGVGDAASVRLRQAFVQPSGIKVYFDVLDGEGRPVTGLTAKDIKLSGAIGQTNATVSHFQAFTDAQEGVAYIFLVDVSKSLTVREFALMKKALNIWAESLTSKDRAAVVTFGESVKIAQDYTADPSQLKQTIDALTPTDQKTQLHQGISNAIELGRRGDPGLPTRRVIITLSDGKEDFTGGMVREEVFNALHEERIPIYAIGFYHPPLTGDKQEGLNALGEFSRVSGGDYFQVGTMPVDQIYDVIRKRILQSYVAQITTFGFKPDGKLSHVQLNAVVGAKSMNDGADVRLVLKGAPTDWLTVLKNMPWWVYLLAFLLLSGLVVGLILLLRKKPAPQPIPEPKPVIDNMRPTPQPPVIPENNGIRVKISVLGGDERENREITVGDRTVLGRVSSESEVVFNDPDISGKHCELFLKDGMVFINDLNSKNGTYLNGVPVKTPRRVRSGDIVMLGRFEFRANFKDLSDN